MSDSIYQFSAKNIKGEEVSLEDYRGKVVLVVNTASNCGFTNQYRELQDLYKEYGDNGLVVLGFPCNQFGAQEPGDEAQIQNFCEMNFGVSFPLFAKVDVNGDKAHPLFDYLKESLPGLAGTKKIKWNFTKFLIDKKGVPRERFAPRQAPAKLTKEIKSLLNES